VQPLNLPAAQELAASTFFAGAGAGLLGIGCCLAYFAPALARRLLASIRGGAKRGAGTLLYGSGGSGGGSGGSGGGGSGSGGSGGGGDSAESAGVTTRLLPLSGGEGGDTEAAVAVDLRSQLARSAEEVARLQVLAFSASSGASSASEGLLAAARAVGGGGSGGGRAAGANSNAAAVWDRREFVQATSTHVSLLLQLLDEQLVDALSEGSGGGGGGGGGGSSGGGGAVLRAAAVEVPAQPAEVIALAEAVHQLLSMTALQAAALVAAHRSAIAASSLRLGTAAKGPAEAALVEQWAASAGFAAFFRSAMELCWTSGALDFAGAADVVAASWTRALCMARGSGAAGAALEAALSAPAARAALQRAIGLHLRLAVWPAVVQSDLRWGLRGRGAPVAAALDSAAHVLFSASGRALGEGASVLLVGPELSDADLRGRGNRAIVLAA
jgi:hypothetical protein